MKRLIIGAMFLFSLGCSVAEQNSDMCEKGKYRLNVTSNSVSTIYNVKKYGMAGNDLYAELQQGEYIRIKFKKLIVEVLGK